MNQLDSQKIYQMGKLLLEKSKETPLVNLLPDKVIYEYIPNSFSAVSLAAPCRILSLGRYMFSSGFSMVGQNSDTYDLLYLFEGEITIQSGSGTQTISSGEAVYLRNCMKFVANQAQEPLDILILRVSGLLASSYYEIIAKQSIRPICLKNKEVWNSLIENIICYSSAPSELNDVLAAHTMSRIYVELYTNLYEKVNEKDTQQPHWLLEIMDYMQGHYSENVTVAHLASRLNISESYFQKVFKEYIGMPPYQYLTNIRISHAKSLLINTRLQVKLIARTVGFHSVNHFIQHFRQLTGMTPTVYRTQQRASEGVLR